MCIKVITISQLSLKEGGRERGEEREREREREKGRGEGEGGRDGGGGDRKRRWVRKRERGREKEREEDRNRDVYCSKSPVLVIYPLVFCMFFLHVKSWELYWRKYSWAANFLIREWPFLTCISTGNTHTTTTLTKMIFSIYGLYIWKSPSCPNWPGVLNENVTWVWTTRVLDITQLKTFKSLLHAYYHRKHKCTPAATMVMKGRSAHTDQNDIFNIWAPGQGLGAYLRRHLNTWQGNSKGLII